MKLQDIRDFEVHLSYALQIEIVHKVGHVNMYTDDIKNYVKELEDENKKLTEFVENLELDIRNILG